MTYRLDLACSTDGCAGTPFFGETASPGYCDSCHVARVEEEPLTQLRRIMDALDTEDDDQRRADLIDAGIGLADAWPGRVAEEWRQYR